MRRPHSITSILVLTVLAIGVLTVAVTGPPFQGVDREFTAMLSGTREVPDNAEALSGEIKLRFSEDFSSAQFILDVSDNTGKITASHIHCEVAGVSGSVVVPVFGGPFGSASGTLTTGTITNADITVQPPRQNVNNVAALAAENKSHGPYINGHSVAIPGRETRRQLFGR